MDKPEKNQAHKSGQTAKKAPKDSAKFATVMDSLDRIDGGFVIDSFGVSELQQAYNDQVGQERYKRDKLFLSDSLIRALMAQTKAKQSMDEEAVKRYPGFDTKMPDGHIHESPNHFDLDKSDSTINIGIHSSRGTWLNGSAVQHHSYVSMRIHGPDNRLICEIALSLEQFAAALISNSSNPCTLTYYWSVNEENVVLQERVKPPQAVIERMKERLENAIDRNDKVGSGIEARLKEAVEKGKMGKRDLEELLKDFGIYVDGRKNNATFVVEQALEESSAIVESAAAHIALQHNLTAGQQKTIKALAEGRPAEDSKE